MRTLATLLLTLSLTAPLACAKSPGPDANPPPASDEGAGEDAGEAEAADSECDFTADPNKKYVGESPDQCAVIRFTCEEGQEYFADDCGCGCQATAA